MKQKNILFFVPLLCLVSCNNVSQDPSDSQNNSHGNNSTPVASAGFDKENNPLYLNSENSIVSDPKWTQGFALKSCETTGAHIVGNLDYNGTTKREPFWQMAQWWAPESYNFINSEYSLVTEGVHKYENESRRAIIDTEEGSIQMALDSQKEYMERYGQSERPSDKPWSHFLLEQTFDPSRQFYVSTLESLTLSFDFSIDECTYTGDKEDGRNEAAQLHFYLRMYNTPLEGEESEVGSRGSNVWIGFPLFDSRYDFVDEYRQADVGFTGATGALICSTTSRNYINEKIQYRKTYHVEIDALEYIKDAFLYGASNDYLPNCLWTNMVLRYLNIGWELPGAFSVASTFSNLNITYTLKE